MPELNYRNYRNLEQIQPELNSFINGNDFALCTQPTIWQSPLLWGLIGAVAGAVIANGVNK